MKARRQSVILDVIREQQVRSQEQLRRRMRGAGFDVTQATLSRDIRELGLVKGGPDGAYQAPPRAETNGHTPASVFQRALGVAAAPHRSGAAAGAAAHRARACAVALRAARWRRAPGRGRDAGWRGHDSDHHAGCPACADARETARGDVEPMKSPVVLAYAGGIHASAAIPWLADTLGVDVVTVTLDVGQGHELGELRARALDVRRRACARGRRARRVRARRARSRRCFTARADRARRAPISALPWPLIARRLTEIARIEGAGAVAHGSTDPAFDAGIHAIDPVDADHRSRT